MPRGILHSHTHMLRACVQGHRSTYYTGTLLTFPTVEGALRAARYTLQKAYPAAAAAAAAPPDEPAA